MSEKNVFNTKHFVFTISKEAQGNLLITLACLINRGIWDLITLVPRAFLFVNKVEHLVLVLICKADAEHKEIHASDWLKPLIAMLLLTLFFLCFTFQIWLCVKRNLFIVSAKVVYKYRSLTKTTQCSLKSVWNSSK